MKLKKSRIGVNGHHKVAVVGMGGVFPTCKNLTEFADKLFSNQSLVRNWSLAESYGKKIRSTVSGFITPEESGLKASPSTILDRYPEFYTDTLQRIPNINLSTADLGSVWGMLGTQDAIKMSGWTVAEIESEKTGVIVGSGGAGNEVLRPAWHNFFELGKKTRFVGSHNVDRTMVYKDAANISCLIKNKGVTESIGSACATGLGNIGHAYRLISFGIQDRAIAGGIEGTSIETFVGFDAMRVLTSGFEPELSSRPFDKNRNGFVCSFGAGIVALENYDMARARGANILGVIDTYFNNSDGEGDMFTPSFDGQKRLWKGLLGDDVQRNFPDVVKAHGTSTPKGDPIELHSTVSVLGDKNYHISAPKSQFGHMLGAAGAVEFITSILMLQEQKVLPCLNAFELNDQPEAFQQTEEWEGGKAPMNEFRHLLPRTSIEKEINKIVCLNYGFGGTNSSILLSRDHD
ncbi:MAG: hypothetical protein JXQ96_02510 [Cyclobacteriaceae bacterium]